MVPKLLSAGKSFKGLARYLTHDAGAETKERVDWTHTLNLAHDDVASAVDEMLWTYRAADMLKRQAGIPAGGRRLENPAKHFSLNWHPTEEPTREHMIETVQHFLEHMGWSEFQALICCHLDRHPHVHVMANAVHPTTGRALDTGFEKRRAQEWAFAYEREHGQIFCEERLLPKEEREASPTREAWQDFKDAEKQHDKAEHERLTGTPDYFERHDRTVHQAKEWQFLKTMQREERKEFFFVEGKQAFKELRNAIFREVREEFREEWKGYYAGQRGGVATETLAEQKAYILFRQNAELEARRSSACADLQEIRDGEYKALLRQHKLEREQLTERQQQGLGSWDLFGLKYRDVVGTYDWGIVLGNSPQDACRDFRTAGAEVCAPSPEIVPRAQEQADTEAYENTSDGRRRIRDPVDALGGVGLGALGAFAGVMERLFDGFLGGGAPQQRQALPAEQPKPAVQKENPARVAEGQMKAAEAHATEVAELQAYWEKRGRRRGRDRD